MGIEYSIISDATREGYVLGKGPWPELPPILRAANPLGYIVALMNDSGFDNEAYCAEIAKEVVAFAVTHSDWRLIDDCSEDINVLTDEDAARHRAEYIEMGDDPEEIEKDFPIYKQVGTRYRRGLPLRALTKAGALGALLNVVSDYEQTSEEARAELEADGVNVEAFIATAVPAKE